MIKFSETLPALLQVAKADHSAVVVPESAIHVTYDSLRKQVAAMAGSLAAIGIRHGDRVAIALPNGLPAIVTFLAATTAGTAAPLNPVYKHDEFLFFLQDTSARLLICPPKGAEEARRAAADLKIPVLSVEMDKHGVVHLLDAPAGPPPPPPATKDVALVLHTSGSTGRPKRVPLRHKNLAHSAANIVHTYVLSAHDVSMCVMPLFHVHGLVASTLATFLSGGTVVIPPKFDPLSFWRVVRENHVTWFSGVPTMFQVLLARAGNTRPDGAESLRFMRSCSTPISADIIHCMEDLFGVPLVEAYGMTEAAHQMASNPLPPRLRKPGSVGMPADVRVSILDEHGKHLHGHDQRGEVVIRGANVFSGYEGDSKAHSDSFADGWFRTGDEGYLDEDGYLHLTGRLKELINRAGEKISPREIDTVLMKNPAVSEAVTFGFPHPTYGEEVAAAVVLHQHENETPHGHDKHAKQSEAALLKYCREHLAEFKGPKKLYIVDHIPQTATGKVRRNAVAAALMR
jgi:acyl-CoA synthetase (AMP-forming)/AMP-acid ligase II